MRPFFAIASNAFMELVRQPVFLLLASASSAFTVILAALPYFGLGDDPKMVKDSVLAVMLLAGLFGAVIGASASVAQELRRGTALAVLSKPVGRARFLLAKYVGVAAAITVLTYLNTVASLIAGRMAYDAYGDADLRSLGFFFGAWALAYGLGGFSNYFLRRPFASDAVFASVALVTVAGAVIFQAGAVVDRIGEARDVDWRMARAAVLILFALWLLAAIALACSTRLELIPTLAICTVVFLVGLMSDYFFGRPAAAGAWWASVLYAVLPNWQLFWLADALEEGNNIPWSYVGRSLGYVAAYLTAVLALALLWFDDRELN
jgi:ABC-type transport system involved in multi-copper enzyme maturation permease subunit